MPLITLHLIRHAQGHHNLTPANHILHDPDLTPLGRTQCANLATTYPQAHLVNHLVSSPLRRTIYTTLLSFPSLIASGTKILALPEIQETSNLPCDTGSSKEELEAEFNRGGRDVLDLSLVHEGWNSKTGKWSPRASDVENRAREARVFLRDLGRRAVEEGGGREVHIAVVTHGGFLHYLTEDWVGCDDFEGTGWANTECRRYRFVSEDEMGGDVDEGAALRETEESREMRKGTEKSLGEAEQRNLRDAAEKERVGQGSAATLAVGEGGDGGESAKL